MLYVDRIFGWMVTCFWIFSLRFLSLLWKKFPCVYGKSIKMFQDFPHNFLRPPPSPSTILLRLIPTVVHPILPEEKFELFFQLVFFCFMHKVWKRRVRMGGGERGKREEDNPLGTTLPAIKWKSMCTIFLLCSWDYLFPPLFFLFWIPFSQLCYFSSPPVFLFRCIIHPPPCQRTGDETCT